MDNHKFIEKDKLDEEFKALNMHFVKRNLTDLERILLIEYYKKCKFAGFSRWD